MWDLTKTRLLIFERLVDFIQESGIVTAMVGLLNAPHGTKLYQRMKQEGRLLKSPTGDNTDFSLNFIPKMSPEALLSGYNSILKTIYSPKHYYARVKTFLKDTIPHGDDVREVSGRIMSWPLSNP